MYNKWLAKEYPLQTLRLLYNLRYKQGIMPRKLYDMKRLLFVFVLFLTVHLHATAAGIIYSVSSSPKDVLTSDSLPNVLSNNHADLIESRLRDQAVLKFGAHQIPSNRQDFDTYRTWLRNSIIQKTGLVVNPKLPLNIKETGSIQLKGYKIKNIAFQTLPGVYATANLYIPDGKGPFPAVINMLGHWRKGKSEKDGPQPLGHSLALNGYVCLTIDPWGAGERTSVHGVFEYHGANLGASLLNIGESLNGIQISDNMRGVDLLISLPYVDPKNIGATGASGGGNQTMWLAAIDERIKAAVPVVSIGTFESYIMRSNCVCELLNDGLTLTEEAGVLLLIAPRALKMCNHKQDAAPSFFPLEMQRTFENTKQVYKMLGAGNNISSEVFDRTHGYWSEDREAMLGWFDLHLKGKGTGTPKKELPFEILADERLYVYPIGQRDTLITTTAAYSQRRGKELRTAFLKAGPVNVSEKQKELRSILRIDEQSALRKVHQYTSLGGWNRLALESSDDKLVPVLHMAPAVPSMGYVIISNPAGKKAISLEKIVELKKKGHGIVVVDLSGTGEVSSKKENTANRSMILHTQSRSELWLGKTILGEWVKELGLVSDFLRSNYLAQKVSLDGTKESGLAGLFLAALGGQVDDIVIREAPLSYQFDTGGSVDFFSMGIHLPGFLVWGDVSLAAALSGKNIEIINPVSMSGVKISGNQLEEYQTEYARIRTLAKQQGKTIFN